MIFVTVGTHEQPFNRLIQKIDELIDQQLSHFSKRVPADLEETQALVQLLLARMLAKL